MVCEKMPQDGVPNCRVSTTPKIRTERCGKRARGWSGGTTRYGLAGADEHSATIQSKPQNKEVPSVGTIGWGTWNAVWVQIILILVLLVLASRFFSKSIFFIVVVWMNWNSPFGKSSWPFEEYWLPWIWPHELPPWQFAWSRQINLCSALEVPPMSC